MSSKTRGLGRASLDPDAVGRGVTNSHGVLMSGDSRKVEPIANQIAQHACRAATGNVVAVPILIGRCSSDPNIPI